MAPMESHRWPCWRLAVLAAVLIVAWQWATVTANYGGNWSALYCTGAIQRRPPLVASEKIYLFANSPGYDGQFYHYIAHDPFLRSGLQSYVDNPRYRYRRILVPLLAYGLALGRPEWIDPAYELVFLLSIGLGVYWSRRFVRQTGLAAAWGLTFLLMPAIPIAADRLVVDAGLAALTAAFLCYGPAASWKLFLVLACAALTRETGLLLVLAYCGYLLWRRELRTSGLFLLSALPAIVWYGYVQTRTTDQPVGMSFVPLSAILHVLGHPWTYPAGTPFVPILRCADYFALAGVLLGFGFAFAAYARAPSELPSITALLFAMMGLGLQLTEHWLNVYAFGRIYTPLLLCLAAAAAQQRKPWLLAPAGMILPRLAMQLTPQILGVIRWMA